MSSSSCSSAALTLYFIVTGVFVDYCDTFDCKMTDVGLIALSSTTEEPDKLSQDFGLLPLRIAVFKGMI